MLKIALVAPFEEPVPPKTYGGTERIVYNIAEELVALGHDVTLFASGDSKTSAKLEACVPKAVRVLSEARNPNIRQGLHYQGLATALTKLSQSRFDIVHNHFGWQLLLFKDLIAAPIVTTLHGILSEPTERYMHTLLKNEPFISISKSQRRHNTHLRYIATVYNGIRVSRFKFEANPQNYLVFLGRIHPHKGPEHAIQIARRTGNRLIIAAKIDPFEQHYFDTKIAPLIDDQQIQFVGEVNHAQKVRLLKNAKAMISPIQWDEPFGITTIESLACGTPVLALNRGAMPEILINNQTGFLCKNVNEIVKRVGDIGKIDREVCRSHVENHFSAQRMTQGYLKAYERVITRAKRLR